MRKRDDRENGGKVLMVRMREGDGGGEAVNFELFTMRFSGFAMISFRRAIVGCERGEAEL